MSYGVPYQINHGCGHPLIVVDFDADPPPIPVRVEPGVTDNDADGRWLYECPTCHEELDGWALLDQHERDCAQYTLRIGGVAVETLTEEGPVVA